MDMNEYSARREALDEREIAAIQSGNTDEFYRIHSELDVLDNEFQSVQEIKEPTRFGNIARKVGKAALGLSTLAGLAITGVAKDMSGSSLDDSVNPYFAEDNSEPSDVFDGQVGVEYSNTNCEEHMGAESIVFNVFLSDELKENESLDSLFIDNVIFDYNDNSEAIWPNDTDPFLQRGNYNFTIDEWHEEGPSIKVTTKIPIYSWNHSTNLMEMEEGRDSERFSEGLSSTQNGVLSLGTLLGEIITLHISDYDFENRTAFLKAEGIDRFHLMFDLEDYNQYSEEGNGSHLVPVAALESYDDDTPLYNVIEFAFDKEDGRNDLNIILPGEMGVSTYDLDEHCVNPAREYPGSYGEDDFIRNREQLMCGLGVGVAGAIGIPAIISSRKEKKTPKVHVHHPRVETPKTPKKDRKPKVPKSYDSFPTSVRTDSEIPNGLRPDEELEADIQGWKDISESFELPSNQASEKEYYESLMNTLRNSSDASSYNTAKRTYEELRDRFN